MTKKQLNSVKYLYEMLKAEGKENDTLDIAEFRVPMTKAKVMIPWATIEKYKKKCGNYCFTDLFESALGISTEVEMPESFPAPDFSDFADLTLKDAPSKKKGKVSKKPPKKSKENPPPPDLLAGGKAMKFKDPVFLVESVDSTSETAVVGITKRWERVWGTLRTRALHDPGKLTEEQAKNTVDHMGVVIIPSSNCNTLYCVVTKMELE